ncbi:MAG: tRNA ((37)-C2)-methylthiotransferase MiaB [Verrucomicrobiota bacterium]|jgi:tRNA-2-methylthio-N6-dimethylallyladenosine synthase
MPSVFLKTYGCQMNERDSEAVAAQLVAKGYSLAPSEAVADVVLLNTCSVRDNAEQKAISKMENLAGQFRKQRPGVLLGFLGCMAQSRGKELIDQLPDVDLVVGTQKFHRVADYVDDLLAGRRTQIVDTEEERGSEATIKEHLLTGAAKSRAVTAFVSIMQGCNQYCTFCIVPYTRGQERSRTIPDIVAECRELVARGVKEITLLGQIVTSYGRRGDVAGRADLPVGLPRVSEVSAIPRTTEAVDAQQRVPTTTPFVQLLDAVHAIEGLERIRFTSPHPKGYGPDLVAAYARLPKLVESAHLPVQSGSDRMLKLMHRGYTRARYLEIIRQLRAVNPEMGITTDIIVGFPGETEADFAETLSLAREVQFDNAFVFKYSPRRDTPAAAMPDQLPEELIEARHAQLLALINEIAEAKHKVCEGRVLQILVEGPSRKNPARLEGRTRSNKIVIFEGSERHIGQVMDVKITHAAPFTLYGDPAILNLN